MKTEVIYTGKSIELALEEASRELGIPADKIKYEVIEQEKSGFLGIGSTPAKIKVEKNIDGQEIAKNFIDLILSDMEIDAKVEYCETRKNDCKITIDGEEAGVLIGHHGDTLEALQYLTNLAANKREEEESRDYVHISIDIENYREKREATLRALAGRMAKKVKKTGKNVMLEPMPPFERRIIHSEVQSYEGVSTNSIGTDETRRVVIYLESNGFSVPSKRSERSERLGSRRSDRRRDAAKNKVKEKTAPIYDDGEKLSDEELSDLISTYGSKEKPQREQPKKFKDFDEYINSIVGTEGTDSSEN